MIKISYYDADSVTALESLLCDVTISGDAEQAARKLCVTLQGTTDGQTRLITLEKGCELRATSNDVEVFRGIIFADSIDTDGRMSVTAYDYNFYLTKNADSRKFEKMTASGIIKSLCTAFGIAIGRIVDTGYVIPKMIFENKNLWDMMIMALTHTKKMTGRQYFIYSDEGKLCVDQFTKPTCRVVFEPGVNLISGTRSTSIVQISTRVRLLGKGKKNAKIDLKEMDAELEKKYGIMQALESPDSDTTASAAKQRAEELLKQQSTPSDELSIECLGIDDVVSGSGIYLIAPLTGAVGGYYVASDTHKYEGEQHTMSLTLSKTDVLPTLEYEAPKT